MAFIVSEEEKPSLEELALEHFGVKGMKWGVVKAKLADSKAPTGKVIRKARRSVNKQERKLFGQHVRQLGTFNKEKRAARKTKMAGMKLALLNDPDRATAARITRGEKALILVLGTPLSVAGAATTAGILGASTAQRKIIEKRQREGFYNKRAAKK